ncbi:hypothetical protein ATCC90586_009109 [Pythium insidiosum]|nr:hypothetical protein ATCC90586_009109 [Pythium insidiosum]
MATSCRLDARGGGGSDSNSDSQGEGDGQEPLTLTAITQHVGGQDPLDVTDVEIIFAPFDSVHPLALRQLPNLQRFTLINCRLRAIPVDALAPVRTSLVHLCLSAQRLTAIAPLDLPNLRALYLQQNAIRRIEGLERCGRLQRLWLYGNRLTRIEGLERCTDLRELWLQDNAITTLQRGDQSGALDELAMLETLCLAKNRLRDVDELHALRRLAALRHLSLSDAHFGGNPLTRHPEYRSLALATLRQLATLDGVAIDVDARTRAVDDVFSKTLAFNDSIAELSLAYEQELRAIETRRQRGQSNAAMLQQELVEALNALERSVLAGQREVQDEAARQRRLREDHTALLQREIEQLRLAFHERLDRLLERELRAMEREDEALELREREALAAQDLALTIATLEAAKPLELAFQRLAEHTPDHRRIASLFASGLTTPTPTTSAAAVAVAVLDVYRFFHETWTRAFVAGDSGTEGSELLLFAVVSDDDAITLFQSGFAAASDEWLFLFADPLAALRVYERRRFARADDAPEIGERSTAARSHCWQLVLCRTRMPQVLELHAASADSVDALLSVARSTALPTAESFGLLAPQRVYFARRSATLERLVLPEFLVLCASRPAESCGDGETREEDEQESESSRPEELLVELHARLQQETAAFEQRLAREIDPSAWLRSSQQRATVERLRSETTRLRQQIQQQHETQHRMVSEMMAAAAPARRRSQQQQQQSHAKR